ncbi:rhamnulokinase [Nakamurella leprariae]|uniref:Rhamnulokinase n=1 Tax=Nakamurella leprariae TaxID=2803911 RepID=A0A939C2M6_9ACTN|nr:rhamnulokinase family protein [Nakamurella leprariae]MBM9468267.1 rhamnulokinase [Nakamurella leprariae]
MTGPRVIDPGTVELAAVDLGASSGRVMLGRIGSGRLELTELHRFRNGPVRLPDGLYWDVLGLYQDVLVGLGRAVRQAPGLAGAAIDSWAVDYGLVDPDGALVGNPRHYRDARTAAVIDRVHATVDAAELYRRTGLQHLPFNTLYQFAADPAVSVPGRTALLVPDLLGYWLTGRQITEQTNASTTGLLDARTGAWDDELIRRLGFPDDLLAPLLPPGEEIGPLTPEVATDLSLSRPLPLTTVGSHDTASAVLGVPADTPDFGYISCGTWGLVGVELDAPVLTDGSRDANFTNERGVDGTVRYLRNVMGLWLLSESVRTWQRSGTTVDLAELIERAAALPAGGPRIDPDDPVFAPPGDMPERIRRACAARDQPVPDSPEALVRCVLDSLATAFAATLAEAERLSGRAVSVVHLVGGGSQNALLCQLTADTSGRPVVAGPVEATALGNLLVQARTHGALSGDRWALRRELRRAVPLRTYRPAGVPAPR